MNSAQVGVQSAQESYNSALASYGGETLSLLEDQLRTAQKNYEDTLALFDLGAASQVEVDQAQQTLNSAQANIDAAQASLNAAQTGVSSAQAGVSTAQVGVANAEAGVNAARVGIASAEYQLSLYSLTAPISGVVEEVNLTENNLGSSGSVAFVISNNSNKTVTFYVTDLARSTFAVGQSVSVEMNGRHYSGSVTEISGVVDPSTGLFQIKAAVEDAGELSDGLRVSVTTTSSVAENSLIVPSDAIYFDNGIAYVYVVQDGVAVRKDVEVSLYTRDRSAISSGISEGDEVINTWSATLRDGAPVLVANKTDAKG